MDIELLSIDGILRSKDWRITKEYLTSTSSLLKGDKPRAVQQFQTHTLKYLFNSVTIHPETSGHSYSIDK